MGEAKQSLTPEQKSAARSEKLAKAIESVKADSELKPDQKERQVELLNRQFKADEENDKLTGKGVRQFVGMTRGKGTQVIGWKAFDDSKPDTLPGSVEEFLNITNIRDDKSLVGLLIEGFNSQAYSAASDPIAEYVEAYWPEEVQKSFRVIVRQYANTMEIPLDEAVNLVKPGIDKKYKK